MSEHEKQAPEKQRTHDSVQALSEELHGVACSICNHVNPQEAKFCAECGTDLAGGGICWQCSAAVKPGGDICETCGAWLRRGQCTYCYAPVAELDSHCGKCSNPTGGIICKSCGEYSIFDFCPRCAEPLSFQARELADQQADDPALTRLRELASACSALNNDTCRSPDQGASGDGGATLKIEVLRQLARYRATADSLSSTGAGADTSGARSLFSDADRERVQKLGADMTAEVEQRRKEETAQRKLTEQESRDREKARQRLLTLAQQRLQDILREHEGKKFSTNQEARRFFMSIVARFPAEVREELEHIGAHWKWRCNAFNVVHDIPMECARPEDGGTWFIE